MQAVGGISYLVPPAFGRGGEDKVSDNLGISGGAEFVALVGQLFTEVLGIDDIAIVGDGNRV